MAEMNDTNSKDAGLAMQGAGSAAQSSVPSPTPNFEHTKIRSNFTQSPSTYWALMLPLLGGRYAAEAMNEVFEPLRKALRSQSVQDEIRAKSQMAESAWAFTAGGLITAVTSFYTISTYKDMKRQFSESVGWEFDKAPEKVNAIDMWKSKNEVVHDAVRNLAKRTALRFAADLPFFAFKIPTPFKKGGTPREIFGMKIPIYKKGGEFFDDKKTLFTQLLGPKGSVIAGVGANSIYLATDALGRKKSFFEEEQHLVTSKINHTEAVGEIVTAQDLINLYDRQVHSKSSAIAFPKMSASEWQADVKLFERMADLMNQTYNNAPKVEHADFTVPKFIYLVGMGQVSANNPESSRAYVEVANRYGIPAVKKVAHAVKSGATLSAALTDYPVNLAPVNEQPVVTASVPVEHVPTKTFTSEALKRTRPEAPLLSHAEKAAQQNEAKTGQSIGA